MAKKTDAGEVRVKLLTEVDEGKPEAVVRLQRAQADKLIAAQQARLAQITDFSFGA